MVAAELAAAYRRMVAHYRQSYQLPPEEALARADEPPPPEYLERLRNRPAEGMCWYELQALAASDFDLAVRRWEEVKQAAREELRSKVRAAKAVEGFGADAWERAQFCALYLELADGSQPRNGIERQLLDNMAQAQTALLGWLKRLTQWTSEPMKRERSEPGAWTPPRLTEAEAVEQAAGMVDRFHRLFVRSLRALTELRRRPLAVVVQGAGQVNIADKQVNVGG